MHHGTLVSKDISLLVGVTSGYQSSCLLFVTLVTKSQDPVSTCMKGNINMGTTSVAVGETLIISKQPRSMTIKGSGP